MFCHPKSSADTANKQIKIMTKQKPLLFLNCFLNFKESTKFIFATLFFSTIILGCGGEDSLVAPRINLSFAPGASPQNVTRVKITITAEDFDPITREFEVTSDGKQIEGSPLIPPGKNRRFFVEAFNGDVLVLSGEQIVDILAEQPVVTILLDPVTVTMKFIPDKKLVKVGEIFVIDLVIKNAVELFAMTCELEFDENLLEPVKVETGALFGRDVLLLEDSNNRQRPQNRLSIGITLKSPQQGITESGVAARITFEAKKTGNTLIRVAPDETLSLQTPDGGPVADFQQMVNFIGGALCSVEIEHHRADEF